MSKLVVFYVLLLACCGYALLRGGGPERIGASFYAVGTGLTILARGEAAIRYGSLEVGPLIVDLAALISFLVLALYARRFWPLWMTAFQAIGTAGHLAKLADPEMIRWAYAFLLGIWSYPMLLLLALGTWRHQQRLKHFGSDPAWSPHNGTTPEVFRGSTRA
jgi:hypothetical protein